MSEYADNYMTDEKNVHWVKMDYVGPIMKKNELSMDKLEAKEKGLELDLGLAGVSIYESKVLLTSCENSLLRRDNLIESLEADNKVLTARIKALENAGNDALADMRILFKNQARDPSDGSYLVDGECANELSFLINSGVR